VLLIEKAFFYPKGTFIFPPKFPTFQTVTAPPKHHQSSGRKCLNLSLLACRWLQGLPHATASAKNRHLLSIPAQPT
jgi:hypothetical protein